MTPTSHSSFFQAAGPSAPPPAADATRSLVAAAAQTILPLGWACEDWARLEEAVQLVVHRFRDALLLMRRSAGGGGQCADAELLARHVRVPLECLVTGPTFLTATPLGTASAPHRATSISSPSSFSNGSPTVSSPSAAGPSDTPTPSAAPGAGVALDWLLLQEEDGYTLLDHLHQHRRAMPCFRKYSCQPAGDHDQPLPAGQVHRLWTALWGTAGAVWRQRRLLFPPALLREGSAPADADDSENEEMEPGMEVQPTGLLWLLRPPVADNAAKAELLPHTAAPSAAAPPQYTDPCDDTQLGHLPAEPVAGRAAAAYPPYGPLTPADIGVCPSARGALHSPAAGCRACAAGPGGPLSTYTLQSPLRQLLTNGLRLAGAAAVDDWEPEPRLAGDPTPSPDCHAATTAAAAHAPLWAVGGCEGQPGLGSAWPAAVEARLAEVVPYLAPQSFHAVRRGLLAHRSGAAEGGGRDAEAAVRSHLLGDPRDSGWNAAVLCLEAALVSFDPRRHSHIATVAGADPSHPPHCSASVFDDVQQCLHPRPAAARQAFLYAALFYLTEELLPALLEAAAATTETTLDEALAPALGSHQSDRPEPRRLAAEWLLHLHRCYPSQRTAAQAHTAPADPAAFGAFFSPCIAQLLLECHAGALRWGAACRRRAFVAAHAPSGYGESVSVRRRLAEVRARTAALRFPLLALCRLPEGAALRPGGARTEVDLLAEVWEALVHGFLLLQGVPHGGSAHGKRVADALQQRRAAEAWRLWLLQFLLLSQAADHHGDEERMFNAWAALQHTWLNVRRGTTSVLTAIPPQQPAPDAAGCVPPALRHVALPLLHRLVRCWWGREGRQLLRAEYARHVLSGPRQQQFRGVLHPLIGAGDSVAPPTLTAAAPSLQEEVRRVLALDGPVEAHTDALHPRPLASLNHGGCSVVYVQALRRLLVGLRLRCPGAVPKAAVLRHFLRYYPRGDGGGVSLQTPAVPPVLRLEVWEVLLGLPTREEQHCNFQTIWQARQHMLRGSDTDRQPPHELEPTTAAGMRVRRRRLLEQQDKQIRVDLPRCHAADPVLSGGAGQAALLRVLQGFIVSRYLPAGRGLAAAAAAPAACRTVYYQGLDSLCAVLVRLAGPSQEAVAYALLDSIVQGFVAYDIQLATTGETPEEQPSTTAHRGPTVAASTPAPLTRVSMADQLGRLAATLAYEDPELFQHLLNPRRRPQRVKAKHVRIRSPHTPGALAGETGGAPPPFAFDPCSAADVGPGIIKSGGPARRGGGGGEGADEAVSPDIFSISWFLALFAYRLPHNKVLRLWDFLFFHAPPLMMPPRQRHDLADGPALLSKLLAALDPDLSRGADEVAALAEQCGWDVYPHCLLCLCVAMLVLHRDELLAQYSFSGCLAVLNRCAATVGVIALLGCTERLMEVVPVSLALQPYSDGEAALLRSPAEAAQPSAASMMWRPCHALPAPSAASASASADQAAGQRLYQECVPFLAAHELRHLCERHASGRLPRDFPGLYLIDGRTPPPPHGFDTAGQLNDHHRHPPRCRCHECGAIARALRLPLLLHDPTAVDDVCVEVQLRLRHPHLALVPPPAATAVETEDGTPPRAATPSADATEPHSVPHPHVALVLASSYSNTEAAGELLEREASVAIATVRRLQEQYGVSRVSLVAGGAAALHAAWPDCFLPSRPSPAGAVPGPSLPSP